mmetsp:Transcript_74017/g.123607  ORF Transcript_74017/g.123607 Transcript_74017/m.123607 type:complete len:349 (-) Transcript_74017:28-1074(-)
MNRVKHVERINQKDIELQLKADTVGNAGKWDVNKSWHAQYKHSAYVYVGGLPYDLSEGDVTVVFSQVGEIVDINIPRDKTTGRSRGFAFIGYEDQRSTVLAVDNFNGAKLLGKTLRVDHCEKYTEEQKKDPNELPEHVTRKLNEKEIEKKRRQIIERNAELDEHADAKADLFAEGRGTRLTNEQMEEQQIRCELRSEKELDANRKRLTHIEGVRAKRKQEYAAAASEEERKQAKWEERRRQREQEEVQEARKLTAVGQHGESVVDPAAAISNTAAANTAPVKAAIWGRLMGGGGSKKKQKTAGSLSFKSSGTRAQPEPKEQKRFGEDSMSVEETNKMRAELGLAPLKS